jgi:hypothetical protein
MHLVIPDLIPIPQRLFCHVAACPSNNIVPFKLSATASLPKQAKPTQARIPMTLCQQGQPACQPAAAAAAAAAAGAVGAAGAGAASASASAIAEATDTLQRNTPTWLPSAFSSSGTTTLLCCRRANTSATAASWVGLLGACICLERTRFTTQPAAASNMRRLGPARQARNAAELVGAVL